MKTRPSLQIAFFLLPWSFFLFVWIYGVLTGESVNSSLFSLLIELFFFSLVAQFFVGIFGITNGLRISRILGIINVLIPCLLVSFIAYFLTHWSMRI